MVVDGVGGFDFTPTVFGVERPFGDGCRHVAEGHELGDILEIYARAFELPLGYRL